MLIEFSLDTAYFQASGFLFPFTTKALEVESTIFTTHKMFFHLSGRLDTTDIPELN
ncbi:MAG: hypothetical protein ACJAZT_000103 [Gammaproteobacteria bacterium]|jgi:hypothetical protein